MTTAYNQMLKIDQDKMAVRKSIDLLLHLLHDFIPHSAFRDAERTLYEAFERDGIELTSKMMRKEYEAWRSTQIDGMMLQPLPNGWMIPSEATAKAIEEIEANRRNALINADKIVAG